MSAASTKTQDPSMDEILASIRRIIADDQDAPRGPDNGARQHEIEHDDDVLDLAEMPDARVRAPADLEVDVPDLSFQSVTEPEPPGREPAPEPAPRPEPVPRPEPQSVAEKPVPAIAPPEPAPAPRQPETIVSNETTASVSHAFNLLSHTILTQNARTLEDLVGEMLKPMLKMWLDDNLPPLVERLVRAEIERVARGSR
ncbi:PopZ family protein [uncultured Enterovirga sp.]|uniref:PopZ family protein n=1 Tax=uncultured Enterovirga sp. TaxID=2026352 RepID=UPI0035CBF8BA